MSNLVVLKCDNKAKFEKMALSRLKMGIFNIFFKRLSKEVLKIWNSIVIEHFRPVPLSPIKWQPLKGFAKLHKSPLLTSNIIKGAVSGLRQFLATESP